MVRLSIKRTEAHRAPTHTGMNFGLVTPLLETTAWTKNYCCLSCLMISQNRAGCEVAMGGSGSGTREGNPTTDAALRLDVRWLARQGLIAPGIAAEMALHWTRTGLPDGTILVRYDARRPDQLLLIYRTRATYEADWTTVHDIIPLERTPCHYGGERLWCRCPGCDSRRAVLYGLQGRFRCVTCHRLAYRSTREDRLTRLNRRGRRLTDRLRAEPAWVLDWLRPPAKPPGMHAQTYARLCRTWWALWRETAEVAEAELGPLIERLERRFGEGLGERQDDPPRPPASPRPA